MLVPPLVEHVLGALGLEDMTGQNAKVRAATRRVQAIVLPCRHRVLP